MPSVSIIIISFNTLELTRKCLASVRLLSAAPLEVIVVDNASSDGSAGMVKSEFPEVRLIENEANAGFARANNQAMGIATGEFVWLLNSDTEAAPDSLGQALEYFERFPEAAAVIPQLVYPDGGYQSVGGYFPTPANVFLYFFPLHNLLPAAWRKKLKLIAIYPQEIPAEGLELEYLTGAALIIRKEALDRAGLLAEEYFMYFEETDLCYRLRKNGYRLIAAKTDPVMHVYGGSFRGKLDGRRIKMFEDSLQLFARKNIFGWKRQAILLEAKVFGPFSRFLKSLKSGNI